MNLNAILLFALISIPITAHADHEIGHGGSTVGADFVAALNRATANFNSTDPMTFQILASDLAKAKANAKVISTQETLTATINGTVQDCVATNDQDNTILVNESMWEAITNEHIQEGIALHEYLSLAKLEDTGIYTYSAIYLSEYNLNATGMETGQVTASYNPPTIFNFSNEYLSVAYSEKTHAFYFANGIDPSASSYQALTKCQNDLSAGFGLNSLYCSIIAIPTSIDPSGDAVEGCITVIDPGNGGATVVGGGTTQILSRENALQDYTLSPSDSLHSACASDL